MIKCFTALIFVMMLGFSQNGCAADAVSVNDVYTETLRVQHYLEAIQSHEHKNNQDEIGFIQADLRWHHVWAKSYTVLKEINLLRQQHGMERVEPVNLEPQLETSPRQVWEMCRRIITELEIVVRQLQIQVPPFSPSSTMKNFTAADIYWRMQHASTQLNRITGGLPPTYVYAEARRLNDDVNQLLSHLEVIDSVSPPRRLNQASPIDAMQQAFNVLQELHRLQRYYDLPVNNLQGFNRGAQSQPKDVFVMITLLIAELQTVKARVGLNHALVPNAGQAREKSPVDVAQLLGYVANKLQQIKTR